jgi:hypothetical protein
LVVGGGEEIEEDIGDEISVIRYQEEREEFTTEVAEDRGGSGDVVKK